MKNTHELYMKKALEQAEIARENNEIPVGCVIVKKGIIIGVGYNESLKNNSGIDHAEIVAIKNAAMVTGDWRFLDSIIYITLEPCLMCAGAILNCQFGQVVYGASNMESGVLGGVVNVFHMDLKKHTPKIKAGILKEECEEILQDFFKDLRNKDLPNFFKKV